MKWVKALATKPEKQSWICRTIIWKKRTMYWKSSSDFHTWHAHTHTNYITIIKQTYPLRMSWERSGLDFYIYKDEYCPEAWDSLRQQRLRRDGSSLSLSDWKWLTATIIRILTPISWSGKLPCGHCGLKLVFKAGFGGACNPVVEKEKQEDQELKEVSVTPKVQGQAELHESLF